MSERPKFFDDLAGVAGGAFSALAGLREEAEGMIRARVDETIRRLDLVKREDLEAVHEMAARARSGQEAAETRLAALEAKVAGLAAATAIPMPHSPGSHSPVASSPVHSDAGASGHEAPPAAMPPLGEAGTPMTDPPVM